MLTQKCVSISAVKAASKSLGACFWPTQKTFENLIQATE